MSDSKYIEIRSPDEIRVAGSRVGVEQIVLAYLSGALPEEIVVEYPTLSLEQVHGVIAYYLGNRQELDGYLRRWQDASRQARAQQDKSKLPDVVQRLRDLAEQRVA